MTMSRRAALSGGRRQNGDNRRTPRHEGRVLVVEVGDGMADLCLYGAQQMNEIQLRRMATDEARTPPQTPPRRPFSTYVSPSGGQARSNLPNRQHRHATSNDSLSVFFTANELACL